MKEERTLDDLGLGLFSYFEPDKHSGEELFEMLSSAKRFQDFKKEAPRTAQRHFSGVGFGRS